jgi:hypothetical protein
MPVRGVPDDQRFDAWRADEAGFVVDVVEDVEDVDGVVAVPPLSWAWAWATRSRASLTSR